MIEFFSKKMSPTEQNYTANDKEHLALINCLEHLRRYLEGSAFELITENRLLEAHFWQGKVEQSGSQMASNARKF